MVVGQVILTYALDYYLEVGIANVLVRMIPSDAPLTVLVVKNLSAHRSRNSKTAIMFSLCVAYVIFAGTLFSLQAGSLAQQLEWSYGSDLIMSASSYDEPLPESDLRSFLSGSNAWRESLNLQDLDGARSRASDARDAGNPLGILVDYSFATFSFRSNYYAPAASLTTFSRFRSYGVNVVGIEPQYLSATLRAYYISDTYNPKYTITNTTLEKLPDLAAILEQVDPVTGKSKVQCRSSFNNAAFPVDNPLFDFDDPLDDQDGADVFIAPKLSAVKPFPDSKEPSSVQSNVSELYSQAIPAVISQYTAQNLYGPVNGDLFFAMDWRKPGKLITSYTKYVVISPLATIRKWPGFRGELHGQLAFFFFFFFFFFARGQR
jgi:hypothetical protein